MDKDARRRVVRAARVLLRWDQGTFAKALDVGLATLKRYEAGYFIAEETEAMMLGNLANAGVALIDGANVGGRRVTAGVALMATAVIGDAPSPRKDAGADVKRKGGRTRKKAAEGAEPGAKPRKRKTPKSIAEA